MGRCRVSQRGRCRALRYRGAEWNGRAQCRRAAGPAHRIPHRHHLGDVVEESDGDLMGDGVNIASRLEGVATPGAICLSEDAYRQVKARLTSRSAILASAQLKNIAEPIRVYSLQGRHRRQGNGDLQFPAALASTASPPKLSIAVLPFANMSGDAEQEYFADGISKTRSRLSRFSSCS